MSIFRSIGEARRTVLAAGAAMLLHAMLFFASARARVPEAPTDKSSVDAADATEIEVLPTVIESAAAVASTEPVTSASGGEVPVRLGATAVEVPTREPAVEMPSSSEPGPPGSASPLMIVTPTLAELGVGPRGPNPLLGAMATPESAQSPGDFRSARLDAPSKEEAKRAVEQSMRDGTRDVGLGPEGLVLHALEDAARGGLAPERGSAMFLATIDGSGAVIDLRLLSSNDHGGWDDARKRAAQSLAGKKLALRGAKGATLQIAITSDVRLPSGSTSLVQPSFGEGKVVLPENIPAGGTADVVKTYKVGTFDLSDLGAKPTRIVHARLVSLSAP